MGFFLLGLFGVICWFWPRAVIKWFVCLVLATIAAFETGQTLPQQIMWVAIDFTFLQVLCWYFWKDKASD